jgi:hypothetical protein
VEFLGGLALGTLADVGGWITAFGVTLYAARLVYTGKLVPRSTYDDQVKALEIERARNAVLMDQIGRMADSMETVERVVSALPAPPQQGVQLRRGGGR